MRNGATDDQDTDLEDPTFKVLHESLFEAIDSSAQELARVLKQMAPDMLAHRRRDRAGFERRLRRVWKPALDLYEAVTVACQEAGDAYNAERRPQAAADSDVVFEALTRLHARACRTAEAIRALLESGHATDALARWRTMHEIVVVMSLMRKYGAQLAERYLTHDVIETLDLAEQLDKASPILGLNPIDPALLLQLRERRDRLVKRNPPEFMRKKNGWAAGIVPSHHKTPTFEDLEKAADYDQLRLQYKLSSYGIHAEPRGIFFQLEIFDSSPLLLAGPGNAGLSEPGTLTLNSLLLCTIQLLTYDDDDAMTLVKLRAIQHLANEASEAFSRCEAVVRQRSESERNKVPADGSARK